MTNITINIIGLRGLINRIIDTRERVIILKNCKEIGSVARTQDEMQFMLQMRDEGLLKEYKPEKGTTGYTLFYTTPKGLKFIKDNQSLIASQIASQIAGKEEKP